LTHDSPDRSVPSWTSPYRFALALRLLRSRKINLISILGVMLGVASIIVVLAVMDGFQRELREVIRGSLSDLIVELEFPPDREVKYADVRKAVEAVPGVEAATIQRHAFGLIPVDIRDTDGARQKYIPVRIVGIVPDEERRVSRILGFADWPPDQPEDPFEVSTARWIPEEEPRILVSDWIAQRAVVDFLDRLTVITFEERPKEKGGGYQALETGARISRIYRSGNSEFDKIHVYVDMERTRARFFDNPDATITELRVKLHDYRRVAELRPALARALAPFLPGIENDGPLYRRIETWEQRQHNLLLAVNNEKFILAFVLFFIVLVACFTIFATLTMTVVEKTKDIGVLRALGATAGGVLSIFVLNGTLVGLLGAALGYASGLYVAGNVNGIREFLRDRFGWDIFPPDIYLFDRIPTWIDHRMALLFALGAAASALVFAVIPSIRAARLRPLDALRYE
jgi:lipoprotein-releasing system permease protein